ncbi:hypothetical protein NQ317_013311 [Molorchus minor]|uniref:Uncharacterized protein n=1 Tax=Molorchus minor TaxID=1323400 RepID=A0ABQ9JA04_9CUCU|nr:hypothetical protein NQ317_013311 [Molorchus minor]
MKICLFNLHTIYITKIRHIVLRYVLNPSNAKQLYSRPDVHLLLFFLLWTQMAKRLAPWEAQANHSPNGTVYNNSHPFNYCYSGLMRGTEEFLVHLGPKRRSYLQNVLRFL